MEQYISKSALVAEIERIKKEECPIDTYEGRIKLFYFERFLSFLDTLEVKEVDLEKEVNDRGYYYDYVSFADRKELVNFVKHFFELGLKAQKGEVV